MTNDEFGGRLVRIVDDIDLGMGCSVRVELDSKGWFVQIRCYRQDVITREMGFGYGGKAYLSEHATDSEIVQAIFGLYKGYWEHEARETFAYKDKRVFGPHISVEALLTVASKVDVRSARHVEDAA